MSCVSVCGCLSLCQPCDELVTVHGAPCVRDVPAGIGCVPPTRDPLLDEWQKMNERMNCAICSSPVFICLYVLHLVVFCTCFCFQNLFMFSVLNNNCCNCSCFVLLCVFVLFFGHLILVFYLIPLRLHVWYIMKNQYHEDNCLYLKQFR